MKLKLVAAVSALAIPALVHVEQSGSQPAVPKPTKADAQKVVQITTSDKVAQNSAADADIDEDFSTQPGQGSTFAFNLAVVVERQVNVEQK
jgi:hypothetical protein